MRFRPGLSGARTRACSVHTRVNAFPPLFMCAGPKIILGSDNDVRLNGVVLDVGSNSRPLPIVTYDMVVRFAQPELLTRTPEQPVSLVRGVPLQRFQQFIGGGQWLQQHVHVVAHHNKCSELVMAEFNAFEQRFDDECGDGVLAEEHRAGNCSIQIAVHPYKSFSCGKLFRRGVLSLGQTSVQVPGYEEPSVIRIDVRESAALDHCLGSANWGREISRSHECERCTHECVRHGHTGRQAGRQTGRTGGFR